MNGKEDLPSPTSKGDIPLNNCGTCASVISYISQLEKRIPPPACAKCRLCNFHKIVSFLSEIILLCPPASKRHKIFMSFACPRLPIRKAKSRKIIQHTTINCTSNLRFCQYFPPIFVVNKFPFFVSQTKNSAGAPPHCFPMKKKKFIKRRFLPTNELCRCSFSKA